MFKKTVDSVCNNTYVYMPPTTADSLKIVAMEEKSLRKILNRVIIDSEEKQDTRLGNYYQEILHLLIDNEPLKNRSLYDCADWLQKTEFENFKVLKIFMRYEAKEIIVISDKMNNAVLDEYYDKFYNFVHKRDIEIVYMIAKESEVDYSSMPRCDKVIEVSQV